LLAKYGGWITLGNVLTPTVIYGDRVVIAAILGASAVAYYAPPFEIVNRLLLIPTALITVLFPALSRAFPAGRLKEARLAFEESVELVGLLFVPLLAVLLANAERGLSLWLGEEYAAVALVPFQLLTVGILFQAGSVIATAVLQASPAFAIPSRIQLVLLLPYFFSLVALTAAHGLVGAAIAWSSRSVIEASLLIAQVRRTAGSGVAAEMRSVIFLLVAAIVGVLAGRASVDARPVLSLVAGCALAATWFRYVLAERTQLIVTTGLRKQLLS
jgi:O-antigen/teichoic acid export membrane protein